MARRVLALDIETLPNESLFPLVEEIRSLPAGSASGDPAMMKQMALDPLYGRIALVGMIAAGASGVEDISSDVLRKMDDGEEARIVSRYADALGSTDMVVTYNGMRFDIPYLEVRARVLGVKLPRHVSTYPWGEGIERGHVDIFSMLTHQGELAGKGPPHDLGSVARLLGIPDTGPDMDGSRVYPTWKAGELAKLREYCLNDVLLTAEMFDRLYSVELGGPVFAGVRELVPRG